MKASMAIEIDEEYSGAVVRLKGADGKVSTKTVSVDDLIFRLAKEVEMTTGILPAGTKFYSGTKNSYKIGIQVPSKVRTIQARLDDILCEKTIPFPETLFVFSVNDTKVLDSLLFACIPPLGRMDDRLYAFPLGNVYDDGPICWGNNYVFPSITDPIILDGVVGRFFSSAFSGHMVERGLFNAPAGVVNFRTLLDHLSGKEYFPDSILKKSKTLSEAMSRSNR